VGGEKKKPGTQKRIEKKKEKKKMARIEKKKNVEMAPIRVEEGMKGNVKNVSEREFQGGTQSARSPVHSGRKSQKGNFGFQTSSERKYWKKELLKKEE